MKKINFNVDVFILKVVFFFKYSTETFVQILILLHGDDDYSFVVVEDFGYVISYSPRTIKGDIQTMVSVSVNFDLEKNPMYFETKCVENNFQKVSDYFVE